MRIIQRIIAPIILLAGGLACLVYGAAVHQAPVTHEEQLPVPMPPPPPFLPDGPFGLDGPGNGSFMPPELGSAPFLEKPTQIVSEAFREARLVRETTVGGVTRLVSGELRRTYTGDAPSLCPT